MPIFRFPANQARRLDAGSPQPGGPTRAVRGVGACLTVLAILAAVLALPVSGLGAWTDCAEAASGQKRISLVVDFGFEPDAPGGGQRIEHACVIVDADARSIDVLQAWAASRGGLRADSSGMICGIAGYPATECGERDASGYRYWQYTIGEGGVWKHSSMGPAFRRANPDQVEGWRFLKGAGNPSDDPPRGSASPSCPPEVPAVGAPAPTQAPPVREPARVDPSPQPTLAPELPGPSDPVATDVPDPSGDDVVDGPADPADPEGDDAGGPEDGARASQEEGSEAEPGDELAAAGADVEVVDGTALAASGAPGPGAPPVGLILAAGLVAMVGCAAFVRSRRVR